MARDPVVAGAVGASRGEPDHYLITHVTLRVALAGVALAILAAFVVDRTQRSCWLTSLSASWYTDARPVFVGGLVAIGVALVAYSGSTWTENLLLDLAGVLAPVVAFAPTPLDVPQDAACLGLPFPVSYDVSAADLALLVYLGALVLGTFATFLASAAVRAELGPLRPAQRRARRIGLGIGVGLVAGLVVWRVLDPLFAAHVHFPAAALMFVLLTGVVAGRTGPVSRLTARWDPYRDRAERAGRRVGQRFPYERVYAVVAVVMALTLVAVVPVTLIGLWAWAVVVAEVVLLVAFLVFWLLQTVQLRLLADDPAAVPASPPASVPAQGSNR